MGYQVTTPAKRTVRSVPVSLSEWSRFRVSPESWKKTRVIIRTLVWLQSSSEYMCEASNRVGRRNATVFVEVLDTNVTAYCLADGVWPLTGAGKSASVECPKNRSTSYASRTCVLTADNVTEWQTADYSRCPQDDLNKITMNVSIPSGGRALTLLTGTAVTWNRERNRKPPRCSAANWTKLLDTFLSWWDSKPML